MTAGCAHTREHHAAEHQHAPGCGHEPVQHGDQLHHPHEDHCDDHGPVEVAQQA
jgi:hypothetical protein